jgi:hypothetical protein
MTVRLIDIYDTIPICHLLHLCYTIMTPLTDMHDPVMTHMTPIQGRMKSKYLFLLISRHHATLITPRNNGCAAAAAITSSRLLMYRSLLSGSTQGKVYQKFINVYQATLATTA